MMPVVGSGLFDPKKGRTLFRKSILSLGSYKLEYLHAQDEMNCVLAYRGGDKVSKVTQELCTNTTTLSSLSTTEHTGQ